MRPLPRPPPDPARRRRLVGGVVTLWAAVAASACVEIGDPAAPCGAADLGADPPPPWLTPADAPVVALSAPGNAVVLHPTCDDQGACLLLESPLRHGDGAPLAAGSPLLVTPAGGYVVAIDAADGALMSWQVDGQGVHVSDDSPTGLTPATLVAGLRRTDSVLVRDLGATLYRYDPGQPVLWPLAEARSFVRAVGERHVVTYHVVDGQTQALFVLDAFAAAPEERPLLQAAHVSQVLITPDDRHVVVSAGAGAEAETFVFALSDPQPPALVDRFRGAIMSARAADDELSGLSAASPRGDRLAYRTPSGALALRDPSIGGSCLVRSSMGGAHRLAGFSASGQLFMEAVEPTAAGSSAPRVRVWDPATRALTALGSGPGVQLLAVPGAPAADGTPWAIGAQDGQIYGLRPGVPALALSLGHVSFLPRHSAALWTVESRAADGPDIPPRRDLRLRPLALGVDPDDPFGARESTPLPHTFARDDDPSTSLSDAPSQGPAIADPAWIDLGPFQRILPTDTFMCISSGAPGSWAYRCGAAGDRGLLQGLARPPSENPRSRPPPEE